MQAFSRFGKQVLRPVYGRRFTGVLEGGAVVKLGALAAAGVLGTAGYFAMSGPSVDIEAIKEDIRERLDNDDWDDGSYGPVLVRLAWHSSGTYCKNTKTGGSQGAAMRFAGEGSWGANAGLDHARAWCEPLKEKFPEISYSDLWVLCGNTAIEEMGGPELPFKLGRKDKAEDATPLPDGRLPDGDKFADHVREIFYRQGFNDQEIVALIGGGHALGRCHEDRSGFSGPWSRAPTTFSGEFFRELFENTWTHKEWNGPPQYEDPTGDLMMLETDMVMVTDPEFRKYSEMYNKDYDLFAKDFAAAWTKLTQNGFC